VGGAVLAAVAAARDAGELSRVPGDALLTCANGSYGTPLALRLAAAEGRPAEEVARLIAERLPLRSETRGGFLTITAPGLAEGIAADSGYGRAAVPRPDSTWPDRPRTFGNPGFSVRYAYVRAASVRRQGTDLGIAAGPHEAGGPLEVRLLDLLGDFPRRTAQAAREGDAGVLKRHLERVAEAYHDVYERCPALPCGDEEPAPRHGARRTLAEAVRTTIGNGLYMLGETPRERL
jgi:arginyl-tRNA synthetase